MRKIYNINTLIAKMLTGEIDEDECRYLQQKIESVPELKAKIEALIQEKDLTTRYTLYNNIDVESAKRSFFESHRHQPSGAKARRVWLRRIAASVVIAVMAVSGWLVFDHNQKKCVPTIDADMVAMIDKVNATGQAAATLTVSGCKAVQVTDADNARVQTEQMEGTAEAANGESEVVEGVLTTRHDKEFWMKLDDGTYVHLNYNTELTYPTRFAGNERRVQLKGEAYFIIAKDGRQRPFIVETAHGDVYDYGTEFNVSTYAQEGSTEVVLVKGKVGVNLKHGAQHMLKPGQMATMHDGMKAPAIEQVDVNLYTSWNTGNFFFDGCSLKELMGVLGRWNALKVDFADSGIEDMQFTGNIDKYEPLQPTLKAIEHITGLKIDVEDKTIFVRKR